MIDQNNFRNLIAAITFSLALFTTMDSFELFSTLQQAGKIKGQVLDPDGAVVPGAVITIHGDNFNRKMESNPDGKYLTELPAGVYRISSTKHGYLPFRRARFRVRENDETMINIVLSIDPDYILRYYREEKNIPERLKVKSPSYDSLTVSGRPNQPADLIIRYDEKSVKGDQVTYVKASASYDTLTIYASRLQFDNRRLEISADEGEIIVEDGKQRLTVKGIVARINADRGGYSLDLIRD